MRRFAGSCRVVFNEALALQKKRYEQGEKKLSYADLCKQLTTWRNGTPMPSSRIAGWLADAPSQPLQQILKDLERAYVNFFAKRAQFPRFKKKGQRDSFRYPEPKQFKLDQDNSRIFLPKLGWLRYRKSRNIPQATSAIGIDVGIINFAAFSDGDFLKPLNSFRSHEQQLKKYQRRVSRKVKGSKNWHKAQRRVQKIHTRIAHVRRDFLHQTTATLSKNHAMIAIEDLQIKNMSKSSKGNKEKFSKKTAAKSGLNKSILDQGWGEFRRQLEYKMQWQGGILIAVPPHYSSQQCPECDHISHENRKTQARFKCVSCGYENHADTVGTINILARGYRVLACAEDISRIKPARANDATSVKQEPTEVTYLGITPVISAVGIPVL
jgi:putative transposase